MNLPRPLSHPLFVAFAFQVVLAYEWLSAGLEKVFHGQFVPTIGKTLTRFGEGNPHQWYTSTLLQFMKDYPTVCGMLVQWGEVLVGIGLVAALALYAFSRQHSLQAFARVMGIAALVGGAFMNLNFYFAAGWMSPSTGGLNALMFWMQVVLVVAWIAIPRRGQASMKKRV